MPETVVRIVLEPGQRLEVVYAAAPSPVVREAVGLEEISQRFGKSVRQLRRLIEAGALPAAKLGRAYSVRLADAERVFAPRVTRVMGKPGNDTDEVFVERLRERGIVAAGGAK